MGKKLNYLFGRKSKTSSKIKTIASLAISRIATLKNHRFVLCSQARSDIVQLLHLGQDDQALLQVKRLIKELNMLDVFAMIEFYFNLLRKRVSLTENNRECPKELKEAISSLIFASSRCGEFPELQKVREIFTSKYGREFAAQAVELEDYCGVNPEMIQKLSTRQGTLRSRVEVLKEIAFDNGINLHLKDDDTAIKEKEDAKQKKQPLEVKEATIANDQAQIVGTRKLPKFMTSTEEFFEEMEARKKSRDAAGEAREDFESRPGVEQSPDDHSGSNYQQTADGSSTDTDAASEDFELLEDGSAFEDSYPVESCSSESERERTEENSSRDHVNELECGKTKSILERSLSASSLDSEGNSSSDRKEDGISQSQKRHDSSSDRTADDLIANEVHETRQHNDDVADGIDEMANLQISTH